MLNRLKNLFVKPALRYTPKQREAVERYIGMYFGDPVKCAGRAPLSDGCAEIVRTNGFTEDGRETSACEAEASSMELEFCLIEPGPDHPFYTLCTIGAGGRRMKEPEYILAPARAEFAVKFPPGLQGEALEKQLSWMKDVLKTLALDALNQRRFYYTGYIVEFGRTICEDAPFCAVMLTRSRGIQAGAGYCLLPGGDQVAYYSILPLYREELEFLRLHGQPELAGRLSAVGGEVYNPRRANSCKNCARRPMAQLHNGNAHQWKIVQNRIAVEEIAAYQEPAMFLRWAIERDLVGEEFLQWQGSVAEQIRECDYGGDLREFFRDELGGVLMTGWLSELGEAFAIWYFVEGKPALDEYRMADIDRYALEYFGEELFYGEMKTEGYLFLPWNEETYQAMAKKFDEALEYWENNQ